MNETLAKFCTTDGMDDKLRLKSKYPNLNGYVTQTACTKTRNTVTPTNKVGLELGLG